MADFLMPETQQHIIVIILTFTCYKTQDFNLLWKEKKAIHVKFIACYKKEESKASS